MNKNYLIVLIMLLMASKMYCGPISGAICSAGCAAVVVACYTAAGAVFGTVTAGVGTPAAVIIYLFYIELFSRFNYIYLNRYWDVMSHLGNVWPHVPQ